MEHSPPILRQYGENWHHMEEQKNELEKRKSNYDFH